MNITKHFEHNRSQALNTVAVHLAGRNYSRQENDAAVLEVSKNLPHNELWEVAAKGGTIIFKAKDGSRKVTFQEVGTSNVLARV